MFSSTLLTSIAFLSSTGWAQYVLEDDYLSNGNFFDKFNFYNSSDPTNGYVDYVERDYAESAGLINTYYGKAYMGVDHENVASKAGRPAVRLESTKTYDSGLVIIDVEHMPGGICGTWPAFWMVGPNWPHNGEIDIIEGVNDQSTNDMTLHTSPGCSISRYSDMQGTVSTDNCDINAWGQGNNEGCQIQTKDTRTYGHDFNSNGGGVYATEITSSFINIFFFPRGSIPSDISSASPDPSSWGKPMAVFMGDCDIADTFKDLQIVFTNTFCGDWAGNAFSYGSCASKADACVDYVKNNPNDFQDAYWSINSLRVYKHGNPDTSSEIVSSYSTSYSSSAAGSSSASSTSWQSYTAEATSTSSSAPYYTTKSSGVAMPTGVSHDAWTASDASYSARPPIAPEASGNNKYHHKSSQHNAVASVTSSATEAQISTESRGRPEGWQNRGVHRQNSERAAKHLRKHKKHGSRRL